MPLTKLEKFLLKGALRANSGMMRWTIYFGYAVFACVAVSYLYMFLTGWTRGLDRAILSVLAIMVAHGIRAYQSLIRKLYTAKQNDAV